uniref:Uncharacterized protein n=1 Tax=Sphaerodactylus townsendi TaxID=933632 RepID=A0ACB8EBE0_9SAUR
MLCLSVTKHLPRLKKPQFPRTPSKLFSSGYLNCEPKGYSGLKLKGIYNDTESEPHILKTGAQSCVFGLLTQAKKYLFPSTWQSSFKATYKSYQTFSVKMYTI